jgi:hypothetical protein
MNGSHPAKFVEPVYLSGVWELSPAGWIVLALSPGRMS